MYSTAPYFLPDRSSLHSGLVLIGILALSFASIAQTSLPVGGCRSDFFVGAEAGQASAVVDLNDGTNDVSNCNPPSNSIFPVGVTSVTCTNISAPSNLCAFNVTVVRPFVVDHRLGTARNDFQGWIGFRLTLGNRDITVTHLGRIVAVGNSRDHQMKILRHDGTDLPGSSALVSTVGHRARNFSYAPLAAPITLQANQSYFVVSAESAGGDLWYDVNTTVTPSPVARVDAGVFAGGGYALTQAGGPNHVYGPVDLLFFDEPANEVKPNVVILTPSAGDFVVASSNLTITTATSPGVTNINFFEGTNLLGSNFVAPFSFTLTNLMPGVLRLTAQVVATNGSMSTSSVVIVNVTTNAASSNTTFLVAQRLGRPRNDFNGFVGMQITVGALPLQITELGRYFTVGNTDDHRVKIVSANSEVDLAGGTVIVQSNGQDTNGFIYAELDSPVTLAPRTAYYILSEEHHGGDLWHDLDTVVTTRDVATEDGAVFSTAFAYAAAYGSGRTYGPVDFKYRFANDVRPSNSNGTPGDGTIRVQSPEAATVTSMVAGGQTILLVNGQSRTTYSVQASDDQTEWLEIVRKNSNGKATIAVKVPESLVRRHYRAIPTP